ncbi:MAG: response regulator transcription factor [Zavarzinia sp.]|nr:response regulator transcription factor [Zavarzinia sp.]
MKVVIADDHVIFRQGLRLALEAAQAGSEFLEAGDFDGLLRLVMRQRDLGLLILDLNMPGLSRSTGIATLRGHVAPAPILVLSASDDSEDVFSSLAAGASGYVHKSAGLDVLTEAIRTVGLGGVYVPRDLVTGARPPAAKASRVGEGPRLTPRQADVLRLAAEGHANKEIAFRLGMGEGTVKAHLSLVMRELGVHNRVQLLREVERLKAADWSLG